MFLHKDGSPQAYSRLGTCNLDQLWALIVAEAVLDATDDFRIVPVDISNSSFAEPNDKSLPMLSNSKLQLAGRWQSLQQQCVADGAGHPSDLTIASLGVRGHHLFHGYVWGQCIETYFSLMGSMQGSCGVDLCWACVWVVDATPCGTQHEGPPCPGVPRQARTP